MTRRTSPPIAGSPADDPAVDAAEAGALYDLLEREVIPEFYSRDEGGILAAWVKRMRESMARLTPLFLASRAVRDYTEKYYLPAATAYHARSARQAESARQMARQMARWKHELEQNWPRLRMGEVNVKTEDGQRRFEVQVYLAGLDPASVRVGLYADSVSNGGAARQALVRGAPLSGALGGNSYGGAVSAARPSSDFTARVIPHFPGVREPLEAGHIRWERRQDRRVT
jgi:starch phosphorylase